MGSCTPATSTAPTGWRSACEAGYIGINAFPPMPPNAPFGGVKQSGFGREGGRDGLMEFLQIKNVYIGLSS